MNFLRKNAVCIQICPFFAVRPDRDLTGKQKVPRARKRVIDEELINHMVCGNSTFIHPNYSFVLHKIFLDNLSQNSDSIERG